MTCVEKFKCRFSVRDRCGRITAGEDLTRSLRSISHHNELNPLCKVSIYNKTPMYVLYSV